MENTQKIAYYRDIGFENKCDFIFELDAVLSDETIKEEIKAVRQTTDTVGSLLQHISNKINSLVKARKTISEDINDEYKKLDPKPDLRNVESGKSIKESTVLKDLIRNFGTKGVEFTIFDSKYHVLFNAPLVRELQLPEILFAGFKIAPSKFRTMYADHKSCKFIWYKSKDQKNWTQIGSNYMHVLRESDVGYYVKLVCVPIFNKLRGPNCSAVCTSPIELMGEIPLCPFDERHKFTKTKLVGDRFRVVSYNVLSCRYTDHDQFPYCTRKALCIEYRKQLIGKELVGYKADIVCLQEVDTIAYNGHYKDTMNGAGYTSFYHKKGNRMTEGLACFFNKTRFKNIDECQIVFSDELQTNRTFGYLWKSVELNQEVKDLFLRQATSLQVTVLKEIGGKGSQIEDNYIIVANTHLFYHPEAEHIRLIQINMATTYLSALRKKYAKSGEVNVIFCGDFNCKPDSEVVKYMTTGKIHRSNDITKRIGKNIDLFHSFKFSSACGSPKYTNYTNTFKDCLDYVFIESFKIKVANIVPLPTEDELAEFEGLPNDVYPSDHLALVVDLEFV